MALRVPRSMAVGIKDPAAKLATTTPLAGIRGSIRPVSRAAGRSLTTITPLAAYNPAGQHGKSSKRGDADDKQRIVLGYHATRNKEEVRESVMWFVAAVGFVLTGMFFIVPEMHIFFPAIYKAFFGND